MLTIDSLSKTYKGGVQALNNIQLEIGAGMFGLLGPNGAGKTTLMRCIAALIRPSSGRIRFMEQDTSQREGHALLKRHLGYLPQELGLYPNLSALEFLDYMAVLKGVTDPAERRRQIDSALTVVRLTDVAKRPLHGFSGGMKRRVGIAQAILGDPRLLIVDEPTAGLDPEERVRFRNLLSEMATRCTVILSTHVIEDVSHSCNDLAIIRKGQVLFRGSPSALIHKATGQVWAVKTQGERPAESLRIVSSLQMADGVQFRVIGAAPQGEARPLEPSLEDGYMVAMGE